jgi:O6-methylguanine-DNA--protein-cysteine methyltransferase
VVVLDVEPNQSAGTIGLAGNGPRGRTVLLVQHRKGTSWMAKSVVKLKEECELLEVRLHPASAAGPLAKELKRRGIEVTKQTTTDKGVACANFQAGVNAASRYIHVGQPEFDAAVSAARTKKSGQAEQWDRAATVVPLGPVVSCSEAAQRWEELAAEPPKAPPPAPVLTKSPRARTGSIATVGF